MADKSFRRTTMSMSLVSRPGVGFSLFNVQVCGQATCYGVVQSRSGKRFFQQFCQRKEILHAFLEKRIDVGCHLFPGLTLWCFGRHRKPEDFWLRQAAVILNPEDNRIGQGTRVEGHARVLQH